MKLREKGNLLFVSTSILVLVLLGFSISLIPNGVRKVSAVAVTEGLGVYWDASCVNRVTNIDWGNLEPGSSRQISIHVRNEQQAPVILLMTTLNWVPQVAPTYIWVHWNYNDQWVNPNEVVKTTVTLSVSQTIKDVTNFGFTLNIYSSLTLPGDFDKNGNVDYWDIVIIAGAYGSTPASPYWNPEADINGNGVVNVEDVHILLQFYGR